MSGWTDRAHRQTTEAAAAERGGMADGGGTSDPMAAVSAPPPRSWSSFPLLRSPPRRRRSKRPIRGGGRTRMHLFPFPWTDGYTYACIPRRCRTSSEVRSRAHAASTVTCQQSSFHVPVLCSSHFVSLLRSICLQDLLMFVNNRFTNIMFTLKYGHGPTYSTFHHFHEKAF